MRLELERVTKVASKFLLSTPIGRGILAFAVGLTSIPPIPERTAHADSPQPCFKMGWTPDAILNNAIDATSLDVAVLEACRPGLLRVEGRFDSDFTMDGNRLSSRIFVPLRDDGTGGDKLANDWIFTTGKIRPKPQYQLTPYEGINDLAQVGVTQVQLVYSDGSIKIAGTPRLFILNESVSLVKSSLRSDSIQTTPHVINMRDDFSVIAQTLRGINEEQDLRSLVNTFYQDLRQAADPYQFLVMTSDEYISLTSRSYLGLGPSGMFGSLRRDFFGTGAPYYPDVDVARLFGSQGNLRGIAFIGDTSDLSLTLFHEITHTVAAYLGLSLDEGAHWRINNSSAGGIVGGTTWIDNRDGTFTTLGFSHILEKLSKLEQYLWGWIPPEQVPPIYVALDENQNFWDEGAKIHGPFKTVTIQDIIAQHGIRTPGPDTALRNLKIGYVYTTSGRLATATEMTARELLAQRLPILWNQATEGQSTMEFVIPPEPGPAILEPFAGKTWDNLGGILRFTPDPDIKQFHIQVIPDNNDGPGINLIIGDQDQVQAGVYHLKAPELGEGNYVMLPGMSYTWRVRTTSSTNPHIKENDPSWSAWSQDTFRTPKRDSSKIGLVTWAGGQETNNRTPTLVWKGDTDVFYYEVQVSKDSTFNTDPVKATAAVYWNLIHGGVTNPLNSYTVPNDYPLEKGATYYWRVRPRVQGDGTPVAWSAIGSFKTSADARVQTYSPELIDQDYGNGIIGPSEKQLNHANPPPEPVPDSPLAGVFYTING